MAITEKITRFDGGILQDLRTESANSFAITEHFDTTFKHKLVPYRSSEADEDLTADIVKFIYANSRLFGYGVTSDGGAIPKIFEKVGDVITSGWTNGQSDPSASGGARAENAFFYYKNYIYGFRAGTALWRYGDITGTEVFTDTYQSVTYTDVAQPVHHPADDSAYFFADNIVYRLDNTTWDGAVLTLPDNLVIVDAEPFGNFLLIACRPKDSNLTDHSTVFVWDRDSSLATITNKIDWGEGEIRYIANLGGNIVGISNVFVDNALGDGMGEVHIRVANSATEKAILVNKLTLSSTMTAVPLDNKIVTNEKLFFPGKYTIDAVDREGIWSINSRGEITLEIVEESVDASQIQGIFKLGSFWFIAHSGDGSINRTDDDANYTFTSIYESRIFTGTDSSIEKSFIGARVFVEPLPTAGQVVLKYKTDEDTAWTTMTTQATDNAIELATDGVRIDPYREIQFRIESTGGAVITGFKFKYEENKQSF